MKIIISISLLLALATHLFAQGDVSQSRFLPKGIIVDGKEKEWVKPLNFYDDKTGMMFAIGNDKTNLYFCFTTNDDMKMRKMMNAGWKLELTSKEKKKKFKVEIEVPGVNMAGVGKMVAAGNVMNIYKSNISSLTLKGFKSNKSEVKLNDPSDIDMAIGADSLKHVVYEIALPLRDLYDPDKINYNELITLNVKVNGIERPNSGGYSGGGMSGRMGGGRSGGGMSGRMGGGGRSGMGGGMGGGRSGGGMGRGGYGGGGGMGGMFESASFKQKFTLARN